MDQIAGSRTHKPSERKAVSKSESSDKSGDELQGWYGSGDSVVRRLPRISRLVGRKPETLDQKQLVSALRQDFDRLSGDVEGLDTRLHRIENARSEPPLVKFELERHGAMVAGNSSRAELVFYELNVLTGSVEIVHSTFRQKRPMAPKLDVAPLAAEVAQLMRENATDPRLKWRADGRVRVLMSEVLPEGGPKQTREGRERRFNKALAGELPEWSLSSGRWWGRSEVGDQ